MTTPGPIRERRSCRLCGSGELDAVFSLTPTPPANAFVRDSAESSDAYPLDVMFCTRCTHCQLGHVLDPQLLFGEYPYVSGTSPAFVAHFERYASEMIDRLALQPGDLVVDIGSNDGSLLAAFAEAGMRVLGVDPAKNIADIARERGIPTIAEFFTPGLAERIRRDEGAAKLVTANNVMAHVDDISSVVDGVCRLLEAEGTFVFEVSYLVDVLSKLLFDTIYHEHLDYHHVGPLIPFFESHGLRVVDVDRVPTHGGSIRVIVHPAGHPELASPQMYSLLDVEREAGLHDPETLRRFASRVDGHGRELRRFLSDVATHHRIAGYGAPAKSTTLLHHFEVGRMIEYIVDDSPLKQGMLTPGFHIPVVGAGALEQDPPDYLVILAWNFAEQIIEKVKPFREAGGKIVVPLPKLVVA